MASAIRVIIWEEFAQHGKSRSFRGGRTTAGRADRDRCLSGESPADVARLGHPGADPGSHAGGSPLAAAHGRGVCVAGGRGSPGGSAAVGVVGGLQPGPWCGPLVESPGLCRGWGAGLAVAVSRSGRLVPDGAGIALRGAGVAAGAVGGGTPTGRAATLVGDRGDCRRVGLANPRPGRGDRRTNQPAAGLAVCPHRRRTPAAGRVPHASRPGA